RSTSSTSRMSSRSSLVDTGTLPGNSWEICTSPRRGQLKVGPNVALNLPNPIGCWCFRCRIGQPGCEWHCGSSWAFWSIAGTHWPTTSSFDQRVLVAIATGTPSAPLPPEDVADHEPGDERRNGAHAAGEVAQNPRCAFQRP